METPNFPPPRDATEQEILDKLVSIRDRLQLLKKDRRTYMQRQDVIPLYQDTVEQVRRLNETRSSDQSQEKNRGKRWLWLGIALCRLTLISVDKVMDSCFQLLSLSFMTIGQNKSAPAAYALTATIEKLLDHLAEVDLFSAKDLESISETVTNLSRNVKTAAADDTDDTSPNLIALLQARLERCRKLLGNLQKRLDRYEEPLAQVHEKLISILRSISLANTRSKVRATLAPI